MLKSKSEQFVDTLCHKPVLQPLFKNKNMVVRLGNEKETVYLTFQDGSCSLLSDAPINIDVSMTGSEEHVMSLINGSERLMLLNKDESFIVEGSQRHLLALESLFILMGESSYLCQHNT